MNAKDISDKESGIEPGQDIEIDLFRPEDAAGVTRLFKTVYGDGYPVRTFMDPELLIKENAAGRTISSVARTPKGDIVGHNALYNSAPYPRLYESGSGLVHPAYRGGRTLFLKLIKHGLKVGYDRFNVEVVLGEPVCNHLITQRACAIMGLVTQAVEVELMPAAAYEREKSAPGRVTTLLDFLFLKSREQSLYIPKAYQAALNFIYGLLKEKRTLRLSEEALPPGVKTAVKSQVFDFAQVARLAVHEAGDDFPAVFEQEERALLEKGMLVIQVWLKLDWPWIGRIVDYLRQKGYFLGGPLPRWFDVDGLLMQKTVAPPDWEAIQIYSENAKEILKRVKADWQETQERASA